MWMVEITGTIKTSGWSVRLIECWEEGRLVSIDWHRRSGHRLRLLLLLLLPEPGEWADPSGTMLLSLKILQIININLLINRHVVMTIVATKRSAEDDTGSVGHWRWLDTDRFRFACLTGFTLLCHQCFGAAGHHWAFGVRDGGHFRGRREHHLTGDASTAPAGISCRLRWRISVERPRVNILVIESVVGTQCRGLTARRSTGGGGGAGRAGLLWIRRLVGGVVRICCDRAKTVGHNLTQQADQKDTQC